MTTERDAELRKLAEAATPGPWYQGREGRRYESASEAWTRKNPEDADSYDLYPAGAREEDAAFIAAANPAVVIGLLDRLAACSVPVPEPAEADLPGALLEAMLGTEDGGFIDSDSEIPAAEMYRLALEFMQRRSRLSSPVGVTAEMVRAFKAAINDEGYVLFEPIIRSGLEAALGVKGGGR